MFGTLNEELAEYIKLLRFKAKKSQEDIAKELNVSRNTYANWENNPISLSLDLLNKIVSCFDEDILIFFKKYVAKCNSSSDTTQSEKEKEE